MEKMSPSKETMQQLRQPSKWLRIFYMVLFAIAYSIAEIILTIIIIIQVILNLLTGTINERLRQFSSELSLYVYDTLRFLTYNTEDKPFPLSDWKKVEKTSR
ncbi:MAG: Unknown protein [uncultured Thiotrichaceae bacterium]|uniref:Lipase n=1 Tax=uncultured Thiotrichaceae bacterium TaxID=298394 RepID=A0A6S6T2J0_9GAMM|nr:MAG: Unknown protein [uncultured Thiotrichaceae bacterium]